MVFSFFIQDLLRRKSGLALSHAGDAERLALDIESKTGDHLGVNTVKRLLGFIDDAREPRVATLNIVARYLGFSDWEELRLVDERSNSSFGNDDENTLPAASLTVGDVVEVTYKPDRRVVLRYAGDGRFNIEESENSKLLSGDVALISHFVQDYPLIVSEVWRDGHSLGSFTAGKLRGINFAVTHHE